MPDDKEQLDGLVKELSKQFGEDAVMAALLRYQSGDDLLPILTGPAARASYLVDIGIAELVNDILKDVTLPPGSETAAGAAAEIIRWIFTPTRYADISREKKKEVTDRVQVPDGEPDHVAPNITANILSVACAPGKRGYLRVTFQIIATSGSDNDDVVSVNLSVPSHDCNGYAHRGLPHVFPSEEERQTHTVTIDIKCSEMILRSENPIDAFIWVQLEAVDDDGSSRTTFMRLTSNQLDEKVAECCRERVPAPSSGSSGSGSSGSGSSGSGASGGSSASGGSN